MRKKVMPQRQSSYACQESLDWIRSYISEYFKKNGIKSQTLWMVDNNQEIFRSELPSDEVVDIVLTGSFFLRLLELSHWPVEKMRLWTLSQNMRDTISELFKIDKNLIGLIPHPETQKRLDETSNNNLTHFVYAGRLSWGKNIEALLALTSYLQLSTHSELELTLFGDNDQATEESFGRIEGEDFDIQELIKRFKWITPPHIMGFQKKWDSDLSKFSHYISLSTSMYEDFAVSPSESMSRLPAVLSDWGGHKHKEGAQLLDSHLIFNGQDPSWIKEKKTILLAKAILNQDFRPTSILSFQEAPVVQKELLSYQTKNFIMKQSPEILLCFREALDVYADTSKGREVFYRYRQQFGTLNNTQSKILIYNENLENEDFDEETLLIHEWDLYLISVQRILINAREIRISSSSLANIKYLEEVLSIANILIKF